MFIFIFFKEAVRIWSLCEYSLSFGLHLWCTGSILNQILLQEAIFSPHQLRQLLELALVLFLLTILILECVFLAHIAKSGWVHCLFHFEMEVRLPIFQWSCYNFEIMRILSPSMKAVVRTCTCAISLDHLDFRLYMGG